MKNVHQCQDGKAARLIDNQRVSKVKFIEVSKPEDQHSREQTRQPRTQIVTVVIRDFSESEQPLVNDLFSFEQPPTTWFSYMMKTNSLKDLKFRITQSLEQIHNSSRTPAWPDSSHRLGTSTFFENDGDGILGNG